MLSRSLRIRVFFLGWGGGADDTEYDLCCVLYWPMECTRATNNPSDMWCYFQLQLEFWNPVPPPLYETLHIHSMDYYNTCAAYNNQLWHYLLLEI